MTEGFEHYRLISIPSLHLEIVERHHQMVQLLSGTGGPSVGLVPVALLDPVGLERLPSIPPPNSRGAVGAVLGVFVLPDAVAHVLPLGLSPLRAEASVVPPLPCMDVMLMVSIDQGELPAGQAGLDGPLRRGRSHSVSGVGGVTPTLRDRLMLLHVPAVPRG